MSHLLCLSCLSVSSIYLIPVCVIYLAHLLVSFYLSCSICLNLSTSSARLICLIYLFCLSHISILYLYVSSIRLIYRSHSICLIVSVSSIDLILSVSFFLCYSVCLNLSILSICLFFPLLRTPPSFLRARYNLQMPSTPLSPPPRFAVFISGCYQPHPTQVRWRGRAADGASCASYPRGDVYIFYQALSNVLYYT